MEQGARTRGNGRFDTEDANRNGQLDTLRNSGRTPFPFWADTNGNGMLDFGEYVAPLPPDQDFVTDETGRTVGPNPYQFEDRRRRFTWREDFSLFLPELGGSHDIKMGAVFEHEAFDRDTLQRPAISRGLVTMGYPANVNNTAVGDNVGLFLQDVYKPVPNLTIHLGLRFDFESVRSFGYTSFDPASERRTYEALYAAAGVDVNPWDGFDEGGLCSDPLHDCTAAGTRTGPLLGELSGLARRHLTRHNSLVDIEAPFLASALGQDVTLDDLLASGLPIRAPEEIRITNSNLAPRLGLTWDPFSDGRSKAFLSWGRYYDKLFLNSVVLEQGPDLITRYYEFDPDGVDAAGPNNQLGSLGSQSAPSIYQLDRGLKTPYTDETTLGYEREISPELSFAVTHVRRDYQEQLQDLDANHRTRRDPVTGEYVDEFGKIVCERDRFGRLSCENTSDGVPDLFIQNFLFNQAFRLGNYNDQSYRGWELELVRRLGRGWQIQGSYTYSVAKGDAESYLSEIGNDPLVAEFERGFLDYDQRHVVKLNAVAFLRRGWRIGTTAQWASGLPYSTVRLASGSDDVGYGQDRKLYGSIAANQRGIFIPEGRNIHRNDSVYDLNARVEKNFAVGKATAGAFFEVFNILNSDDLRVLEIRQSLGGESNVTAIGEQVQGERRFGRRFQVGIRVDF
jgi:hypothetical protein